MDLGKLPVDDQDALQLIFSLDEYKVYLKYMSMMTQHIQDQIFNAKIEDGMENLAAIKSRGDGARKLFSEMNDFKKAFLERGK